MYRNIYKLSKYDIASYKHKYCTNRGTAFIALFGNSTNRGTAFIVLFGN